MLLHVRLIGHLLITPHGDRKPLVVAQCQTARTVLITPHGDRKPYLTRERDRLWDAVGSDVPSR